VRIERTRYAEIEGLQLAVREEQINAEGTLGFREALYYTEDGRLIVHVESWSKQHGDQTICSMLEVKRNDLQIGGRFEILGRGAWAWLRV
jgi:hypothetical protein